MSAAFWGMIALSRILWTAIAGLVPSGFPPLLFDGAIMLVGSLLIAGWRRYSVLLGGGSAALWAGALALGFGCSSYVVAITLPSEACVELSPGRLLLLNLAGAAGEMLMPFALGLAFARGWYGAVDLSLVTLTAAIVGCTLTAWHAASRTAR